MSPMKHIAGIALFGLWAMRLSAQDEGGPGGQYFIHGIYNPVIAEVKKIDLRPQAFDSIIPARPITYTMLPARYDVPARVDSIAPARLNVVQPQQRLYKGFVKAGFGLYTTPLAEIDYDQTRSRENGYGFHYKHLSSNGGIDDVGPSDYGFNTVEGFYKHFLDHHEAGGGITYDRRRVNYYGYDPLAFDTLDLEEPSSDDLRQIYNDIGFNARVRSLYKDSAKVAHDVGLAVHTYSNRTQSREINLRIQADLSSEQGSETYAAGILIDNNAYRGMPDENGDDFRQNGTLIGLMPEVSTVGEKHVVRIGVGMFLDAMGETTFHFYPRAYLSYALFDDLLVPYAGVEGERRRNGFRSLTRENPWLIDAPALANTSLMYDIHGGLRGSVSSTLGFDVRVSARRWKDRPLYVNEAFHSFGNQFGIVYDRVDELDIMGAITYALGEQASVTGRLDILGYTTDVQEEAWNLPPYTFSLVGRYDIRDKLILKGEVQFAGRRPSLAITLSDVSDPTSAIATQQDLEGYMDLFLGAEYRYTRRLSVFFEVSNLSASKYEKWYRYPVQRTLFMGGATFAF